MVIRLAILATALLQVVAHQENTTVRANPTHFGDPASGCETDELAVQVQGVPGDFCSPKCSSGACPSDVPHGVTAHPQCAIRSTTGDEFCALVCTPSALRSNGAKGECGTGMCNSIQGTGLCTYAAPTTPVVASEKPHPALTLELHGESEPAHGAPAVHEEGVAVGANPTHYGDPASGCETDELAVQVQGVPGDFCSSKCSSGACPSDVPQGVTAHAQCALRSTTGDKFCALVCTPSALRSNGAKGECGTGTCNSIQGTGLCTYAAPAAQGGASEKPHPALTLELHGESEPATLPPALNEELVSVGANPTHYGDPYTGCKPDELPAHLPGVSGDFCSPKCSSGGCPSDVPMDLTAHPQCALHLSGVQRCVLVCTPSTRRFNGAKGECGATGTCQSTHGIGICTFSSYRRLALTVALNGAMGQAASRRIAPADANAAAAVLQLGAKEPASQGSILLL